MNDLLHKNSFYSIGGAPRQPRTVLFPFLSLNGKQTEPNSDIFCYFKVQTLNVNLQTSCQQITSIQSTVQSGMSIVDINNLTVSSAQEILERMIDNFFRIFISCGSWNNQTNAFQSRSYRCYRTIGVRDVNEIEKR